MLNKLCLKIPVKTRLSSESIRFGNQPLHIEHDIFLFNHIIPNKYSVKCILASVWPDRHHILISNNVNIGRWIYGQCLNGYYSSMKFIVLQIDPLPYTFTPHLLFNNAGDIWGAENSIWTFYWLKLEWESERYWMADGDGQEFVARFFFDFAIVQSSMCFMWVFVRNFALCLGTYKIWLPKCIQHTCFTWNL